MKAFKTSSCCWFDLETGGLILGYLGTLFWTLTFFGAIRLPMSWLFAIIQFWLAISISWVYGIHKNNHAFMLPGLILDFISLVSQLIYLFVFFIVALIDPDATAEKIKWTQDGIFLWFILFIYTPLQWYFTSVKYSLYIKMKAAARVSDWVASGNSV